MLNRRLVVLGLGASVSIAPTWAQQRRPRIGMLVATASGLHERLLREALRKRGYHIGSDLHLDVRSSGDSLSGLDKLASELIKEDVDVIVAALTPAAAAAQRETATIPIVALVGDAVAAGLVPSLARPGGNLTGVSLQTPETAEKVVGIIREALPHARRVAALVSATDPASTSQIEGMQRGSAKTGIDIQYFVIHEQEELVSAFAEIQSLGLAAAIFQPSLPRRRGLALAYKHGVPIISWAKSLTQEGGLFSYASSVEESYEIIADAIDRLLKGAKAADIPMQQPTRFDLVINLKAARDLGVTFPESFLAQADELIE